MAWLTLVVGGIILLIGVAGQFFGVRRGPKWHPEDRSRAKLVATIGSAVVAFWVIAFAAAHVMHWQVVGHW